MISLEKDAILKLVLRPAAGTGADYTLVAVKRARQPEHYEAVTGRSLQGTVFKLLRPWESVTDVAVVIHPTYLQLAQHLKFPIIMAWNRLTERMSEQKVIIGEDNIFLLTGTPNPRWIAELDTRHAEP